MTQAVTKPARRTATYEDLLAVPELLGANATPRSRPQEGEEAVNERIDLSAAASACRGFNRLPSEQA